MYVCVVCCMYVVCLLSFLFSYVVWESWDMYTEVQVTKEGQRGQIPLDLELQTEPKCRQWDPNSGPLEKQCTLLTTEQYFQPLSVTSNLCALSH